MSDQVPPMPRPTDALAGLRPLAGRARDPLATAAAVAAALLACGALFGA